MMMTMMITKHQYDSVLLEGAQSRRSDNVRRYSESMYQSMYGKHSKTLNIDVQTTFDDAQSRCTYNV